MLFFTDYGNVAKVERCNMDGTNRTRLVDYKIEQPTAVALDVVKKLVYWADAYLDYIDVVDYQGKNRHTIIHGSQVSATLHRFLPSTDRTLWTNVRLFLSGVSLLIWIHLQGVLWLMFRFRALCFITVRQVVYSLLVVLIHSSFRTKGAFVWRINGLLN